MPLKKSLFFSLILPYLIINNLYGFSIEESNLVEERDLSQYVKEYSAYANSIEWELFAKTQELDECYVDEEGFDNCLVKPIYSDEITKLDNMSVTITGFMFPLEASDKLNNFLIGPFPLDCPFHYHIGPAKVIEVRSKKAISFSYDPITITGILKLDYNIETGVFYYLDSE